MKQLYYILVFLCLTAFELQAQEIAVKKLSGFRVEETIKGHYRLAVDHSEYPEIASKIPVYRELIPVDDVHGKVKLILKETVQLDQGLFQLLDLQNEIPQEFRYNTRKVQIRNKTFIEVEFVPLFKSAEGFVERITEYELVQGVDSGIVDQNQQKALSIGDISVLKNGKWAKIKITQSGIYRINYTELVEMGITNPSNPRIFGNGGRMVPEMNNQPRPEGLIENALWIETGPDGTFNQGDYLLFYAEGPTVWDYNTSDSMFIHTIHLYDEASYYFISSDAGSGKTISEVGSLNLAPDELVEDYDFRTFHESDIENLIRSGREWFEPISANGPSSFNFPGSMFKPSSLVKILIRTAARSAAPSSFQISSGGQIIMNLNVSEVNLGSYSSYYAKTVSGLSSYILQQDILEVDIDITNNSTSESKFWLDYIDINARRNLILDGQQMPFRDIKSVAPGSVAKYILKNTSTETMVWDLTDPFNPERIVLDVEGSDRSFIRSSDSLREYIAFNPDQAYQIEVIEDQLPNQDLAAIRDIDMVIVSPPEFIAESQRLANFRSEHDQLDIVVTTPESIYNEFSSGKRDAGAIRDFVRHIYKNSTPENTIKYLLLFGDGSFNNRSDHENNPNHIPTYQSQNSIHYTISYLTDDFYGLLDDDEGGSYGLVDLGIGRLPVNTEQEASIVVNKIIDYTEASAFGPWRNRISFIGDDGDVSDGYTNIHMSQANELSDLVESLEPSFNNQKIMLDAFEKISSPSGATYPEVNNRVNDAINTGSLIINYTGHGNERGLAHEKILGISDIQSWTNENMYPLFITATCEFSRFDDIKQELNGSIDLKTSAGELVLLQPEAGGIALLTTTRLVYSYPNFILNRNFYNNAFILDPDGNRQRLGDVLRMTKNQSGSGINKRNFTLLGDPSLTLSYPEYIIHTDSINGQNAVLYTDTLKGLEKYTLVGHLSDQDGNPLSNYNGTVFPVVFDKEYNQTTLGNNDNPVMEFKVRDKILYNGKATVTNGTFQFSFIMPKDVSFKSGTGKIGYYSKNIAGQSDARGFYGGFEIGGFAETVALDTTGPEINLYLNDEKFVNGGITDPNPIIYALVYDSSGINTLGTGIGHDITAILDGDINNPIVLNQYYESFVDSYQGGAIQYPLHGLSLGRHNLCLKVWDIYNNASETCLEFEVTSSGQTVLRNLFNYPNPFKGSTSFVLEHNLADSELHLEILIYNLSGQIINILKERYFSEGYRLGPIFWDGNDMNGNQVRAGIYVYKVRITSEEGLYQEINNKMMKVK